MSEEDNPMDAMLGAIYQKNLATARNHFDTLMADKIGDALENEKIAISQNIYNTPPEQDDTELEYGADDYEASAEDESEWDESAVENAFDENDLEQELLQAEIDELEV